MGISNCYDGTGKLLNLPGEPGEGGVMAENEVSVYDWSPEDKVNLLRKHIMGDNPHPVAILAANWVAITNYNDVPDWVFALANGNPDMWGDVVEEVRHLIRFDEKKAQS